MALSLSMHRADPSTPGAHERDVGQLEHPLHRAVLAPRAVQQRQHDHRHVVADRGRDGGKRLDRGARGFQAGDATRGRRELAGPAVEGGDGLVGADPVALARDADGLEVVAVLVDGSQHVVRRDARHLVLGRLATEQHDEANSVRPGHGPSVRGRPARLGPHGAAHR